MQYGGNVYSKSDLVAGPKEPTGQGKELSNGALAGYVIGPNGKKVWRIIDAPASAIEGVSRKRKTITKAQAQVAFNKYWKSKIASATTPYQARAIKAAWARDINYTRPSGLRTTTSYFRNPGHLDFEGVDAGVKRYKQPTAKQLANLAYGRSVRAGQRAKRNVKAASAPSPAARSTCADYKAQAACAADPSCGWTQGKGKRAGFCAEW